MQLARLSETAPDTAARGGLSITDVRGTDISKLMNPGTARRQPLAGFDEDYVDIVDYIVRCTHKIWEEKNVGLIYTHYLHNSLVHSGDGLTYGREDVVQGTIKSIAAYPDELSFADDVVWTGNERDGFYTSHRNTSTGRNIGATFYGPPTNRRIRRTGIALCFVRENRIIEEWVVRDDAAVIQGLGLDLSETVERLARRDLGNPHAAEVHGEIERSWGQAAPEAYAGSPSGTGFDVNDFVRRTLHDIWNWRMLGEIRKHYAANYQCHISGNRDLYGRGDYTQWVCTLLAAFPDAQLICDQLFWMDDGNGCYRTSLRWSLLGTHTGSGVFGEPTGVRCRLWGITQHHIRDGQFVEEWTYTNELAILKRLWLARNGLLNSGDDARHLERNQRENE